MSFLPFVLRMTYAESMTVHCIFRYLPCRSKQCIVLYENRGIIDGVRIRQDWTSVEGGDQE